MTDKRSVSGRKKEWLPAEGDWNRLLDEKDISTRRKKAEIKYGNLSNDQIAYLRKRAKTDLFFLCSGVLEYDLLSENYHGHYCRWIQSVWGEQYRMTLQARGHYKTTVETIGDSVQMVLPNDANVQQHPYHLGPNAKILLSHENRESASRFLFEIGEAFMQKEMMLVLFPECIPSRRIHRINKWEFELPRTVHHKEPTFDTLGAGSAGQGRHFNWAKMDDLIGEDARDSDLVMTRILNWFDNVGAMLTRRRIDGWSLTGTHWANNDVYAHAIRRFGVNKSKSFIKNYFKRDIERFPDGRLVIYGRAIEEDGKPAFPEEITPEIILQEKKNPRIYAAQHANNPKDSSLTEINPAWIKFYNVGAQNRITVFAGESTWSVNQKDLDVVILCDPSVGENKNADDTGIVVTGTDKQFNIYILEIQKKILKPNELIDVLFGLYTKWWPRLISIENVAFSGMLKYWFKQKCEEMKIYPNIHDYKPGSNKSKHARIRGLTNYFAAGQVYMLEGMTPLRDELEWFPLGDSEHLLDAFAQGPEIWQKGMGENVSRDREKAISMITDYRDVNTGY